MTSTRKGIVIAVATITLVCAQMAAFRDHRAEYWVGNLSLLMFWLAAIGIPCGAYAGALAGRLRSDRLLVLAGFVLAVPSFFAFAILLAQYGPLTKLATLVIPWSSIPLFVAAIALERWTRPVDPIPLASPQHGRRPWTTVELAVVLTVAAALASAGLVVAFPPSPPGEYTRWYKQEAAFGADRMLPTLVFVAGAALPVGVVLGRLASVLSRFRLITLLAVGVVGTLWVATLVGSFGPLEWKLAYALPPLVAVVVLERLSRVRREAPRPSAAMIGMLLGAANAIAISVVLLAMILHEEKRWDWELMIIPCIAMLFTVPAGAILGGIASKLAVNRHIVLHVIAFGVVLLIAAAFELPIGREPSALGFFVCAVITTAIGVQILERVTRPPVMA